MKRTFSRPHRLERMMAFGIIHSKDGDGGGGGGGDGEKTTFTKEELDAKIAEARTTAADEATAGLKTKNKELLDKLANVSPILKKVEGLDIDNLLEFKQKIENDEILKLASEGKHTEAIEKATEKLKVTHSAELQTVSTQLKTLQDQNQLLNSQLGKLLVDGAAITAFAKGEGLESAYDDIVLRAQTVFKVEDGEVVARDKDGKLIQGEKGPLTIPEWVTGLKKSAGHLFKGSSGGNAGGAGAGGAGGDNGRLEAVKKGPAALRAWKEANKKK